MPAPRSCYHGPFTVDGETIYKICLNYVDGSFEPEDLVSIRVYYSNWEHLYTGDDLADLLDRLRWLQPVHDWSRGVLNGLFYQLRIWLN